MSSIVEFVLTDLGKNHIIAELEFHGHMKWRVWPVISGQALDLQNINFSRYKKEISCHTIYFLSGIVSG